MAGDGDRGAVVDARATTRQAVSPSHAPSRYQRGRDDQRYWHAGVSRLTAALQSTPRLFVYAAMAGTCGALSSVAGKLAVMDDAGAAAGSRNVVTSTLLWLMQHRVLRLLLPRMLFVALPLLLRGALLLLNVACTAQMWRYYVKSLALGPTPVCQIVNTSVNFAVSALAGLLLFGEHVTRLWVCGALLVLLGLGLIVTDAHAAHEQ